MNRTICLGLMVLPVYLHNSSIDLSSGLLFFKQMFPITIAQSATSTDTDLHTVIRELAARDDQPEDCLRSGICKD